MIYKCQKINNLNSYCVTNNIEVSHTICFKKNPLCYFNILKRKIIKEKDNNQMKKIEKFIIEFNEDFI